ncbi:MAG: DUF305 domain-containing protein [Saprospiraceae bacterium]
MTHKAITNTMAFLAVLCLLNGCQNNGNVSPETGAAPKTEGHSQHSMAMMQTMDAMMQRSNAMKMTGDFDVDFANMMVEHHQGAIDMSEIEVKAGSDAQMKGMAQQIIKAQKAEIAKLRDFVQAHPAKAAHQQQMHGDGMQSMHDQMKSMPMSGKVDQDFASMMIAHHQGAVTMAKEEVAKGQHSEMKQMAQQMIDDQQREISEFQAWLAKNK